MKKVMFVCVLGLLVSSVHAQETYHGRLSKGEIIVETKAVKGSDIPEATVTAVIDAPPSKVWDLISECKNYKKTMIRVAKAQEISRNGKEVVCQVTTAMPWPISDLTAKTKATHKVGPPVWSREWQLIEGDFESNVGSWRIQSFDIENTRSLVVYKVHAVPDLSVPDALIKKAQKDTLPDLIKHIRKQVSK